MKLYDFGLILIIVFAALGYIHYDKFHDGKFVDVPHKTLEKQS